MRLPVRMRSYSQSPSSSWNPPNCVVAGHVDELGACGAQPMQGFDHVVLPVAPGRAFGRHPPQVDDVADEVEALDVQRAQEGRQLFGVAVLRTEVHVGDERGAAAGHAVISPAM
jgi:hypothetical protein